MNFEILYFERNSVEMKSPLRTVLDDVQLFDVVSMQLFFLGNRSCSRVYFLKASIRTSDTLTKIFQCQQFSVLFLFHHLSCYSGHSTFRKIDDLVINSISVLFINCYIFSRKTLGNRASKILLKYRFCERVVIKETS